ncbi:phosphate/phosphite/phosphonate ABC transporter substrate-binding protein [Nocardioides daeguensis]|uniref:Phosphonate ABC transporter substrate-binding protein n=1 Tax=Nocardioides daeguensis TaxID=908359 RepID=A0ABP6URR8_9ACTN|nr:phosphate/phosphite/phosphonate ABC transporter substrate-binding protein [Nocardioides daeguensis]MBV6728688.1 phosphate/phosphite/phosphonate ABC transporter substrate-binding protein [Nocardioides daeguensis]MCR1773703.1 phosphate/phosphite/phosphonate ABC transporter substrate-binding protein [Nocardioides daeguensis]
MRTIRTLGAASGVLALALTLAACGDGGDGGDTDAKSDTSPASSAVEVCPDGTLTMGVEPYEDPAKLIPAYQALVDGLGKELGCTIELEVSDTYVAEILAMQNGELDLGQFGPLGFVFANQQAGATALAAFADETGEAASYTGGIWVPKDSAIKTIEDLAGHTLALSESGSTSGDAVPRKALIDAGIDKDVDAQYAGGHTEALQALVNGQVDAAEINSQTLASAIAEGAFDESQFVQVWKSDPILNDPITAGPNMTPEVAAKVQEALLALPSDTVAEIGGYLDFTPPADGAMVKVSNDDYQPLFDLADTLGLTTDDL